MKDEKDMLERPREAPSAASPPLAGAPGVSTTGWVLVGACVRGASHEDENAPCQDAWSSLAAGESAVVCVCDGAGSAARADVGATTASKAAVDHVASALARAPDARERETLLRDACRAAHAALVARAGELGCALRDLACTVVLAGLWPDGITVAHLGDGGVVGEAAAGHIVLVSHPDEGEYANETYFLTTPGWENHLRIVSRDAMSALALFSDGCEPASLLREGGWRPFPDFWRALFGFVREASGNPDEQAELRSLLDGERFRKTSRDDKTLIVVGRRGVRAHGAGGPPS